MFAGRLKFNAPAVVSYLAVSILTTASSSFSQSLDSTIVSPDTDTRYNSIELGVNGIGVGLEYRRQINPLLSVDAIVSARKPGIAAGASFTPFSSILFAQGFFGRVSTGDMGATDGPPPFSPDYSYGYRAGIHFPVSPYNSLFYISLSVGHLWSIQDNYCYNCGVFPPAGVRLVPRHGTEVRGEDRYGAGIMMKF